MTAVTYRQRMEAVVTDGVLQEGAPEACCVAPAGADADSGAGLQFSSGHKPQREPRREKNSRQVNNNNLICISDFEAAVCLSGAASRVFRGYTQKLHSTQVCENFSYREETLLYPLVL